MITVVIPALNGEKTIREVIRFCRSEPGVSEIIVIDDFKLKEAKTAKLVDSFAKLGLTNALMIDGAELDQGFRRAAANIPNIDVLPVQGINVYDILRRGTLVLSKSAIEALEERFK